MKKKFLASFLGGLLGAVALLALVGQALPRIGAFPTLVEVRQGFYAEDRVTLSIKSLSKEESKEYLKGDVVTWGYQAIQVTVENQSADPYLLTPEFVELPLVEAGQVAGQVMKKAIPRSIAFKIAGFFFWPFAIPSTIDSLITIKTYNHLKRGLLAKALRSEIIPPYSVVNRVFFLSDEEELGPFAFHLENQESFLKRTFLIDSISTETLSLYSEPVIQENYYLSHG